MKNELEIKYLPTDDLIGYAMNSRTHSKEQVNQIAASIREFGFTNPILIDETKTIIAGHGRLEGAKKLKLTEVPTITLIGLTDAQRRAYVIADNKLAMNAGWEHETLKAEMQRLEELDYDLSVMGFADDELAELLDRVNFDPSSEEQQGALDVLDPKYVECPHCNRQFDLREVE